VYDRIDSGILPTSVSAASKRMMRTELKSTFRYSLTMGPRTSSERAPAYSTPVAPPPTITKVRIPACSVPSSRLAARSKKADDMVLEGNALFQGFQEIRMLLNTGMPNESGMLPVARIR